MRYSCTWYRSPVRYSYTWYMYILCAIPVPGTCIYCALFLYLVHVYPVRYSCTWYRYIRYHNYTPCAIMCICVPSYNPLPKVNSGKTKNESRSSSKGSHCGGNNYHQLCSPSSSGLTGFQSSTSLEAEATLIII